MYIRPAKKEDDFNEIGELYLTTWLQAYKTFLPDPYLKTLTSQMWAKRSEERWHNILLAFSDKDKLIGVLSFGEARRVEDKECLEIYSLYVLPDYQDQGVGGALMRSALEKLTKKSTCLVVYALEQNISAADFYQKFDFKKQAVFDEAFPDGTQVSMRRFLRKSV